MKDNKDSFQNDHNESLHAVFRQRQDEFAQVVFSKEILLYLEEDMSVSLSNHNDV